MKLFSRGYWLEEAGEEVILGSLAAPGDALLRMKGAAAKRAYELLRRVEEREVYDCQFNCHATAQFVLDGRGTEGLEWTAAEKKTGAMQIDVRRAVEMLQMPCGFQVHSPCLTDGEADTFVLHSGVLLGILPDGEALTLNKNGPSALGITPLRYVVADYIRKPEEALQFHGTPKDDEEPVPTLAA